MLKTAKQSLIYISVSTLLAAFSAVAIIASTDPQTIGKITLGFLYVSLFLTILGLFTIIGTLLRNWLYKGVFALNISASIRQGILASMLVVASLILSSQGLLFWWVEGSLILFLIFFEIFLNLKV